MVRALPPSLSLRQLERGGDVLDPPTANPPQLLQQTWTFVLLIHGYNNDLKAGREAYEGFRLVQRELGQVDPSRPATDTPLIDVYWPGDADWGIVSFLYYPWSIERAKRAAPVLARALGEAVTLSGFKTVDIVAHSMGCRLTLELLKQLEPVSGILVRRVAFMAGAVPVFMFDPSDAHQLRAAYDRFVTAGAMSLFSPADKVLAFAFPVGQTAGGAGEGWFPTALGHGHWASPSTPAALAQQEICGADHSDYWGWNEETRDRARDAGIRVREFLNLGPIPERIMASRAQPTRSGPEARSVVAARETPTRGMESA